MVKTGEGWSREQDTPRRGDTGSDLFSVLVVDDSRANQALFRAQLAGDFEVSSALSGQEALEWLTDHQPDVLIVDVRLPDINGFELSRVVRSHPTLRELPILMVSNLDEPEARLTGLNAGADDYLARPYDKLDLCVRLRLLGRMGRLSQAASQGAALDTWSPASRHLVAALTGNRLHMLDENAFAKRAPLATPQVVTKIDASGDIGKARGECLQALRQHQVDAELSFDLALCVTEAATNAFKHARNARVEMTIEPEVVWVLCQDDGDGIDFGAWAVEAPIDRGAAPRPQLGYGYTIMLALLDRVSLCTGPHGTRILLEMRLDERHTADARARS
jgi:CheY-like chemotaxis protein